MSVISGKTTNTSILKEHSTKLRDQLKKDVETKVRFSMLKIQKLRDVIKEVNSGNVTGYEDYLCMLHTSEITDKNFNDIIRECKSCISLLQPKFIRLVEAILSISWTNRKAAVRAEYKTFLVELLVTHNKYTGFAISKLVSCWIPQDSDKENWPLGSPSENVMEALQDVHDIIHRILEQIPMTSEFFIKSIDSLFPYHRKPPHVFSGYFHNILCVLKYKPIFTEEILRILFQKLLILDVNSPRSEIEDDELELDSEEMFEMDGLEENLNKNEMRNTIAESLDICMDKIMDFIQKEMLETFDTAKIYNSQKYFEILINTFENVIFPAHNPHHVQFVMFFVCSFKVTYAEYFLKTLWNKITNPNVTPIVRQVSVSYIASLLARGKYIPMSLLKNVLKEFSIWAHQYSQACDQMKYGSLKAHNVFYAVCQAVFYVIAFRSKDLTCDKNNIMFLESLQLSSLVTSPLNPLKICLPAVATAFAGVTRAHQLTYCHTILEKNARKKLATIFSSDVQMPEDYLETFFPFDPYLLKKSVKKINPIYLKYQPSEAEDTDKSDDCRKRNDISMDDDDFIAEKRQKIAELSKSHEKEMQFSYGVSPGFHL